MPIICATIVYWAAGIYLSQQFGAKVRTIHAGSQNTVVQSKTRRLFVSAITPFLLTLRLKVMGVLKNSGNSLSDRHQDFPIWAKGS